MNYKKLLKTFAYDLLFIMILFLIVVTCFEIFKNIIINAQNMLPELSKILTNFANDASLQQLSTDANDINTGLYSYLYKLYAAIAAGIILIIVANTLIKALVWANLHSKRYLIFLKKFFWLNIIWISSYLLINYLLFRIIKPALQPYYLIIFFMVFIYLSSILYSYFDLKKGIRNFSNLTNAFRKKNLFNLLIIIGIFFLSLLINWGISFIIPQISMLSAIVLITLALSCSRLYFMENKAR